MPRVLTEMPKNTEMNVFSSFVDLKRAYDRTP